MNEPNKNLYDILGVRKNASASSIKKAYRKKSKELHPDITSNDPKKEYEFEEVNEAYKILSDPKKRKMYDETGFVYNKKLEDEVTNGILSLFSIIINNNRASQLKFVDIVKEMKDNLKHEISETKKHIIKINERKNNFEDIKSRFKSEDNTNVFNVAINQHLGELDVKIIEANKKVHVCELIGERLKKYTYKKENKKNDDEGQWGLDKKLKELLDNAPTGGGTFYFRDTTGE